MGIKGLGLFLALRFCAPEPPLGSVGDVRDMCLIIIESHDLPGLSKY